MKTEKMIVKVNYESGFNFSLLKSKTLIEEMEVVEGEKILKKKYKVIYDKEKTFKMFKSKILMLSKWGGKMVVYGEMENKIHVIDFIRWDNNIREVFFDRKIFKNEDEELKEYKCRFDWLEKLLLDKKYKKVKLIPSN